MDYRQPPMSGFFDGEVTPLEYVKVDENLPEHPKMLLIPKHDRYACLGLFLKATCYCSRNLTDGFVPAGFIDSPDDERLAKLLIDAELFDAHQNGVIVHDYTDYNRSKAEVEQYIANKKTAGQRGGEASARARAEAKGKQTPSNCLDSGSSKINPEADTDKRKVNRLAPSKVDEAFSEFWEAYPRKKGKKAARKAWTAALKDTDADTIIAAVKTCPFDKREGGQYIPHPTTWLNQGCWDDEAVPFPPDRDDDPLAGLGSLIRRTP